MNRWRQHRRFWTALACAGFVAMAESGWLWHGARAAADAERRLERTRRELHLLRTSTGVSGEELDADIARETAFAALLRGEVSREGPATTRIRVAVVPASRADAFFDLVAFTESMRDRARACGVELKADEAFGFASHTNAGPEAHAIAGVFLERLVAEELLEIVFGSGARALQSVQRESPPGARPGDGSGADFFEMDPRLSARQPGLAEALAFRVVFVGETAALRNVLNALHDSELPLLVCAVEVEPVLPARPALDGGMSKLTGTPFIPRALSRFTVTVEFITFCQPAARQTET